MVPLQELIAKLPHETLTEAGYEEFRRLIRRRTLDALTAIEDPAERVKALHKLLEIQPENASKGHLFTEFRRDLMARTMREGQPVYSVEGKRPEHAFEGPDLTMKRRPDDTVQIQAAVEDQLPRGRYAIEDKSGDHAFKLDQAEDYARRSDSKLARRGDGDLSVGSDKGGFKLTPESTTSEYDGLVYVFSREEEAEKAVDKMVKNNIVRSVLGKQPGGIHVMYLDNDGVLKIFRKGVAE